MEVLTVIAAALAFAGGEAAKTVVGEGVKDAYRAVKDFLARKYPQVDLAPVEKAPQSAGQQVVLVENLTSSEAAADPNFLLWPSGSSMRSQPRCARAVRRRVCNSTILRLPRCASVM